MLTIGKRLKYEDIPKLLVGTCINYDDGATYEIIKIWSDNSVDLRNLTTQAVCYHYVFPYSTVKAFTIRKLPKYIKGERM